MSNNSSNKIATYYSNYAGTLGSSLQSSDTLHCLTATLDNMLAKPPHLFIAHMNFMHNTHSYFCKRCTVTRCCNLLCDIAYIHDI